MSVDNLRKIAALAPEPLIQEAAGAYPKYQRLTAQIARKHGFSPRTGAAVFAALSPNNNYHGNLRDTDTLLRSVAAGLTAEQFTVHTYGNNNKRKAWTIAQGAEPLDLIVAKKTRNFFLNVNDPTDPLPVTIDGHMVNCWRGTRANLVGLRGVTRDYDRVAEGVRQVAAERKLLPCQMQAVLWITWKKLHWIRSSPQQEFWDPDYLAAQLGFQF